MSEYQYYEFLSIDRPLTKDEIGKLRRLSTRAIITPCSFVNDYTWGDFKGDPDQLMEHFFDAHVYLANWMMAVFKVRLPIDALTSDIATVFSIPYSLDFKATKDHWIITWTLEDSSNYTRFGIDDGRDWMSRLIPVRDELMHGDFRSLYIGWLAATTVDMANKDNKEPPFVSSHGKLTEAQRALAKFLELDKNLLNQLIKNP